MLESWQLDIYEQAARQMCMNLSENPDEKIGVTASGYVQARWMHRAEQLAEIRIGLEALRMFGFPV